MAISKIIYKSSAEDTGTVWMDVTQKTVTAGSMLNGTTALKNDGTDITGNIASKTSSDLTASGATVTAPAGYYASSASKSVASGTAGTPTATKGTVSNNSVSVTPSVTNTAGYISGGTVNGTAVTVSASELVSGSQTITTNGTYNVTNLATIVVNVGGGTTTVIIPEQTVTVSGSYTQLQYNSAIVSGEEYIVTINGTSKTLTAVENSGSIFLVWDNSRNVLIEYTQYGQMYLDVFSSSLYGSYTVKVEQQTS